MPIAAMRFRWGSHPRYLATWLRAFVLAVCIVLVAIEGWRDWTQREVELREAEATMANLARSLSQQAEDTFQMADLVLVGMAARLESEGVSDALLERLERYLTMQAEAAPRIRGYSIFDARGDRLLTTALPQVAMPNVSATGRSYFAHHSSAADREAFIGPPVIGFSGRQWVVTLTRRYNHPDGSFAGVVLATIRASYFSEFYQMFAVGKQGSIGLLSPEGIQIARSSAADEVIGRDFSSGPLFSKMVPRSPFGVFRNVSPVDGIAKVSAYRRGAKYPVVVVAAVSQAETLAEWRQNLLFRLGGVGALAVLLGIFGLRLAEQVERRNRAEAELARLAATDALTSLANRRAFDDVLASEWLRGARNRSVLSLLLVDIDHFKRFNDTYGHQAGDAAIRAIAGEVGRLAQRPGDLAARYGGEELVLILPDTDAAGAARVAGRIRSGIEALAVRHENNPPWRVLTVSIGYATAMPVHTKSSEIIALADRALYEAKHLGRNRVIGAGPSAASQQRPMLVPAA
jgi:diguanylate cyclase (GGDEF)-like protein